MRTKLGVLLLVCVSMPVWADFTTVNDFSTQYAGYTLEGSLYSAFTDYVNLPYTFVRSAAYSNPDKSNYVYLYQVTNMNFIHTLHQFSAADFEGLTANTAMGYITGTVPADFLLNGIAPLSGNTNNKTIEFSFEISAMRYSNVLFVESTYAPGLIIGTLQNGGQSHGQVIGATIPEPTTLALLLFGSMLTIKRRNV
jgi:hypothetical protein